MNEYPQEALERRKIKLLWNLPAKVKAKIQWDDESMYSFTNLQIGDSLCRDLKKIIQIEHIVDATAGTGGNTISFARHFQYVTAIESDANRFAMLCNNVTAVGYELVGYDNVHFLNEQFQNTTIDAEAVFFDPPWGGPDYKNYPMGTLTLTLPGDRPTPLEELVMNLPDGVIWCILKLPINYDFDYLLDMTSSRWSSVYRREWSKPNSHVVIMLRNWTELKFSDC